DCRKPISHGARCPGLLRHSVRGTIRGQPHRGGAFRGAFAREHWSLRRSHLASFYATRVEGTAPNQCGPHASRFMSGCTRTRQLIELAPSPTSDLLGASHSGCCGAMCTQALAEPLRRVVKVLRLWA